MLFASVARYIAMPFVTVVVLIFGWSWPPNWPWLHVSLALLSGLIVTLYFVTVTSVEKRLLQKRISNVMPEEEVLSTTHYHKVMLVPGLIFLISGSFFAMMSLGLGLLYPSIDFATPLVSNAQGAPFLSPMEFSIPIWEIPLLLSMICMIFAAVSYQRWKYSALVLTTRRLIQLRELAPYIFWLGESFDQTPLEQIIDIDEKAGGLGSVFHWSTIKLTRVVKRSSDASSETFLRLVPNGESFAAKLRNVCPRFKVTSPGLAEDYDTVAETRPDLAPVLDPDAE